MAMVLSFVRRQGSFLLEKLSIEPEMSLPQHVDKSTSFSSNGSVSSEEPEIEFASHMNENRSWNSPTLTTRSLAHQMNSVISKIFHERTSNSEQTNEGETGDGMMLKELFSSVSNKIKQLMPKSEAAVAEPVRSQERSLSL